MRRTLYKRSVYNVALAYCLCGTRFGAGSAGGAFGVINACEVVFNMYGVVFALFLAYFAADTAAFADAPHYLSNVGGGAANVDLFVDVP